MSGTASAAAADGSQYQREQRSAWVQDSIHTHCRWIKQVAARTGVHVARTGDAHAQPRRQLTMAALRSSSPATTAARPAHDTAVSFSCGAQRSSTACSMQAASMAVQ